jgi:hypothetical protein
LMLFVAAVEPIHPSDWQTNQSMRALCGAAFVCCVVYLG